MIDKSTYTFKYDVWHFTQNNSEYIIDSFCFQSPEQIIGEEGPVASEAGPASSGAGEVPSHGQVGLQDASQGAEVSMLPGDLLDASQEAGASRSQEGAAFLLAGSLSQEVLAACEAGLRAEEASEPWDESQEDPGAVEAFPLVAAQVVACSPRPPSCSEEAAPG